MKLCHLHLQDYAGNKQTLVCKLKEGSIRYIYYGGWGDSGLPYSTSNLQCELPINKLYDGETKEEFVARIIHTIKYKSVVKFVKQVATEVEF